MVLVTTERGASEQVPYGFAPLSVRTTRRALPGSRASEWQSMRSGEPAGHQPSNPSLSYWLAARQQRLPKDTSRAADLTPSRCQELNDALEPTLLP